MNNELQKIIIEKVEHLAARYEELCILTSAPEIIAHNSYWRKLLHEQEGLSEINENYRLINSTENEIAHLTYELNSAKGDYKELLNTELAQLLRHIDDAYSKLKQLLGKQETADARVELSSRDGGSTCLETLANMYVSYATSRNYKAEIADDATNKFIVVNISSLYYDLKTESGIHRIIQNTAKKNGNILVTVFKETFSEEYEILDSDIRIDLFHSGGAGGQNVNKVESAIRATHLPTGISVVCQDERSQLHNKERALKTLKAKVESFFSNQQESAEAEERKEILAAARHKQIRTYDFVTNKVTDKSTNLDFDLTKTIGGALDEILSINKFNL